MEQSNEELAIFVGNKIRKFRKQRRMKQIDLGKKINKSPNTVSEYEKGVRVPNAKLLLAMAQIFEVEITEFYPENDYGKEYEQIQFGFYEGNERDREINENDREINENVDMSKATQGWNHSVLEELNEYVAQMDDDDKVKLINYVEVTFEMFKRNNPLSIG